MKKSIGALLLVAVLAGALVGCSGSGAAPSASEGAKKPTVIKVGATPVPAAEILRWAKGELAKENIDLQVVEFTDYVQPNLQLAEKALDANLFQHQPYLTNFAQQKGLNLIGLEPVYIVPMAAYSRKVKALADLPQGAVVSVPNDPTNGGRALLLLEQNGLIKLKDGLGAKATVRDVADNPKGLQFRELEAAQLPRSLSDVDLAVIPGNYALDAKLNPGKEGVAVEPVKNTPFANLVAVRKGEEQRPELQKLNQLLHSQSFKQWLQQKYNGAVFAVFE